MQNVKKFLSVFLAVLMLVCSMPMEENVLDLFSIESSAASFSPRLTAPARTGYYSNNTSTNPYSVNTSAGNGNCTWYAWGRAYEILGSRPKINTIGNACTWYTNNKSSGNYPYGSEPKLGAIACWSGGSTGAGHVAVVEQIHSDGTITISESSWSAKDWWFRTKTINSNGYYSSGLSFQGYIYILDDPIYPPSNAWVALPNGPESSYKLNETFNITFGADWADTFHVYIWREYGDESAFYHEAYLGKQADGNNYCSVVFDKPGHYSCVITAYNALGSAQSEWIGWDIVDTVPTNVWVSLPNGPESSYKLNETFHITFGADWADTFHVYIWREYGDESAFYHEAYLGKQADGNNYCSVVFDKPGHYSCVITAYNALGSAQSEWIGWDIVDAAPYDLTINTDQKNYTTDESVNFSLNAKYATYKHIGIHKIEGNETYLFREADVDGTTISLSGFEPGNYRANFDAINAAGTTRSDWTYFSVCDTSTHCSEKIVDNKFLKSEATCTSKAIYYQSCSVCGAVGNATFEYGSELGHNYTSVVTTPALAKTGYITYQCSECEEVSYEPITYYVKYNANGGKGTMDNSSHTFGVAKALTSNAFTRTGYTFLGWSKSKNATTASYVDCREVSGLTGVNGRVVNLYAVWKPINYSVKYNANGGKGTMENSTHTFGVSKALTANTFTRTGYTFLGWARSKSATTSDYVDGKKVSGLTGVEGKTVVLYAVWKPINYSVKYNANGGTGTMSNSSHTFGTAKALSANKFTRTGYTFLGWSKTKTATTASYVDCREVSGLTGVEGKTVVLYAVWKPINYSVKYHANGGTGTMSNSSHTFGTAKELSANKFTRTGYTFLGWSKTKNATTASYTDEQVVKGLTGVEGKTVVLYAVWKPINYSVKYNANGGTGTMANSAHTFGTSKALSANKFTRTGYTFLGWSRTKNATTATYTNKQVVKGLTGVQGKTVTLYAVWQKK